MIVLHYASISKNNTSGVSVIVPQIVNAQSTLSKVALYNYGSETFKLRDNVTYLDLANSSDDYHTFPYPFNKPDIVVFHSPFGMPRIVRIVRMLCKENIPYVIVPHGCFSTLALKKKRIKKILALKIYFRHMLKNTAAIQYLSEGEKEHSISANKLIVIPNGVDIGEYCEKKCEGPMKYVYIGRKDVYRKGIDLLLEAFTIGKQELEGNSELYIYGPEDSGSEYINQYINKYKLQRMVFNCLQVFGLEKAHVFHSSDVLILASRSEGQPVIVLEAWANQCPTILTQETNVSEEAVTNKCGWKMSTSSKSLLRIIEQLRDDRKLVLKYSNNAYEYVRSFYGWETIANKYMHEYEKIIKNDRNQ